MHCALWYVAPEPSLFIRCEWQWSTFTSFSPLLFDVWVHLLFEDPLTLLKDFKDYNWTNDSHRSQVMGHRSAADSVRKWPAEERSEKRRPLQDWIVLVSLVLWKHTQVKRELNNKPYMWLICSTPCLLTLPFLLCGPQLTFPSNQDSSCAAQRPAKGAWPWCSLPQ